MFSSSRPDFEDSDLHAAADTAFADLVRTVAEARGAPAFADPAGPPDVAAVWALAHGIADLLASGRPHFLQGAIEADADAVIAAIFARLRLGGPGG